MEKTKEYEVTLSVSGFYHVTVHAESEEEARQIACNEWSNADFGELENIDADIWHIN